MKGNPFFLKEITDNDLLYQNKWCRKSEYQTRHIFTICNTKQRNNYSKASTGKLQANSGNFT